MTWCSADWSDLEEAIEKADRKTAAERTATRDWALRQRARGPEIAADAIWKAVES